MNKFLFAAVGVVLALTACTIGQRGFKSFGVQATNVGYVSVDVIDDYYIVVSQEPIYVKQQEDNAIYWYLKPGGPYYFPDTKQDRGIDFQSPHPTGLSCHLDNGDQYTFICTYKKATKKKYLYTIKVTKDGKNILISDPTVMNN
ncbi:MAG: hypothetical protein M3R31_07030 [Pseudomonadota bacterium]|nr:hypothetical protein [Pseudomonadota bacterium]